MQDRPTAPELLDALAGMLFAEVREWVPRERRFQVLVAANVCAVVARELRAGEGPSREDLVLFRALLGSDAEPGEDPAVETVVIGANSAPVDGDAAVIEGGLTTGTGGLY
jgi:hypothetical protein